MNSEVVLSSRMNSINYEVFLLLSKTYLYFSTFFTSHLKVLHLKILELLKYI